MRTWSGLERVVAYGGSWLSLAIAVPLALGQGTQADYQRADKLRELTQGKVFKAEVRPQWFAEGTRFWYRNDLAEGRHKFIAVNCAAGQRTPAFDHARLAAALAEKLAKEVTAEKLPIEGIEFVDDNAAVRFPTEGKFWKYTLADGADRDRTV